MIEPVIAFRRRLLRWYDAHRRDLPWRHVDPATGFPNAYHVLVSELMLQQTQVATVIGYFQRFIARWPDIASLAAAGEQEVLRQWQGLGYYSRAVNLLKTARRIETQFGGRVPVTVEQLMSLPGIGRYTAGAIASIAYGQRAPILDGNVMRVLCRLDGIEKDPRAPEVQRQLWGMAQGILPRRRVGDFNSALMELGAVICRPRSPECHNCPVRMHCRAAADNRQEVIPRVQRRAAVPLVRRWTYCIEHKGRWLIERRPDKGRWAGLWQFITLAGEPDHGLPEMDVVDIQKLGLIHHALTHRRYEFVVYRCRLNQRQFVQADQRRWVSLAELDQYPMSRPHLKIAERIST